MREREWIAGDDDGDGDVIGAAENREESTLIARLAVGSHMSRQRPPEASLGV